LTRFAYNARAMGVLSDRAPAVPTSVCVGVLATLTMDVAFVAASRLGGTSFTSDKIGPELVGRWAVGLARGRLRHEDIETETPVRGEAAVGLAVHYFTGVALTQAYYAVLPRRSRSSGGVAAASAYGVATALLPFLIMYPSWGIGVFALRSGEAARVARIMLLGHTVFGAGIGLWTALLRGRSTPS
jgi:hypothetical protein